MSTTPSPKALQADIAARRERLARTLDELTARTQPKALIEGGKGEARSRFAEVTTTPEGELRVERVAAVVAAVAVIVVLRVLAARRRRRR